MLSFLVVPHKLHANRHCQGIVHDYTYDMDNIFFAQSVMKI